MTKEKIGIITFQRTSNFGSVLQAYALYLTIVRMGFPCDVIDYRCPAIEKREYFEMKKIKSLRDFIFYVILFPKYKEKADELFGFLKYNVSLSAEWFPDNISEIQGKYDIFLVGSDIVWGRDITNYDYTFFLDFVRGKGKKIAFSSSVGDYDLMGDENKISKLLCDFKFISVRENETISWLNSIGIENVKLTCDPTMLLKKEDWDELIKSKKYNDEYVLIYFLDDYKKAYDDAIKYAKKHHLRVYYIHYGFPKLGVHCVKPTSLEEFLGLIKCAKMVFTASYHGMLFSIYYEKQFVFYTRAHKARVLSLANKLGVASRCADKIDILSVPYLSYDSITPKVEQFRQESINVLQMMIN